MPLHPGEHRQRPVDDWQLEQCVREIELFQIRKIRRDLCGFCFQKSGGWGWVEKSDGSRVESDLTDEEKGLEKGFFPLLTDPSQKGVILFRGERRIS